MEHEQIIPGLDNSWLRKALFIRKVEERLFALYGAGKLHGTMHGCLGQEFSALAFCGQLEPNDAVFSNHRCHGHYLAKTGDAAGLIAELLGKKSGVCAGLGGSQHLCREGFFSNGVQGGIAPLAAGMGLAFKRRGLRALSLVFIGDGTLGQGVVYETANLAALHGIPLLVALEDNGWAQSTPREAAQAGDIATRFDSFGFARFMAETARPAELFETARQALSYVRENSKPAVCVVRTERLCSHSKSDDHRPKELVDCLIEADPLNTSRQAWPVFFAQADEEIAARIDVLVEHALAGPELSLREYQGQPGQDIPPHFAPCDPDSDEPYGRRINQALQALMHADSRVLLLGEDLRSPYGGAFKITAGLSELWPERVPAMPISEAGIMGLANGLALAGERPIVEIMFGDFCTLILDQLINHAAKFNQMYNRQAACPVIVRLPMGGGRGYGPTHSQTLDKLFLGLDGLRVAAPSILLDPCEVYEQAGRESEPLIIIENKNDYSRRVRLKEHAFFRHYQASRSGSGWPTFKLSAGASEVSLITYGGCLDLALQTARELYFEHEILAEIILPTCLNPLPWSELMAALSTPCLFTLEEGSAKAGFGALLISGLAQRASGLKIMRELGSLGLAIPSAPGLEREVLISPGRATAEILEAMRGPA